MIDSKASVSRPQSPPWSSRLCAGAVDVRATALIALLCLLVVGASPSRAVAGACPSGRCPASPCARGACPSVGPGGQGLISPIASLHGERRRDGPGAAALRALAECLDDDYTACISRELHGGERVVREARLALESGSIPIERPAMVERYRRLARERDEEAHRRVFSAALADCEISIASVGEGLCDDTGWVEPPPLPLEGAAEAYGALLRDLWEDVSEGLGQRRARRLICGTTWTRDGLVAQEALVILADRDGREKPALLDLRCERVERVGDEWVTPAAPAERPPWPPPDPTDAAALTAMKLGVECLGAGGGECIRYQAPLPGILTRHLMTRLPEIAVERRQPLLDSARQAAIQPRARSSMLVDLAPRQCWRLRRLSDPTLCTAAKHRPAKWEPDVPARMAPAEDAQARAVAALLWGAFTDKDITASTVTCPSSGPELVFEVVWTSSESGNPLLLDIDCP